MIAPLALVAHPSAAVVALLAATLFFVERRLGFWPYGIEHLKAVAAALLAAGATALAKGLLPLPGGLPALAVFGVIFMGVFAATIVALRLNDSDRKFLEAFWAALKQRLKLLLAFKDMRVSLTTC